MPKVSVIIPVYNAEKYLHQCIDSVLNQKFTDFEILLINDGSKDRSGEICDEYAKKDKRIKVFHKENGGVSSARNLGLDNAKGEWITFVDSDDIILEHYLQNLYADVQECNFVFQDIIRRRINNTEEYLFNFNDETYDLKAFLENHMVTSYGYVVGKLFNHNLVSKHKIRFDNNIKFAEDALFLLDYLYNIDTIKLSSNKGYIYYERENSLVKSKYTYEKELELLIKAETKILKLFAKNFLDPNSIYKYKELQYYITRVIISNVEESDLFTRKRNLRILINQYEPEFLYLYRNSKMRGRLIYYFVKYKQIRLLDYLLSIIYKTN